MRSALMMLAAAAVLAACGEPAVGVDLPQRSDDEHVADLAGALGPDAHALEERLRQIAGDGRDIVALAYVTDEASCGEAYRAAKQFVQSWDADVAIVAVARPGDFDATDEQRQRCLGVQPRDDRAVPGALREQIAEQIVPPKAAENDWAGAFTAAAEALAEQ